MTWLNKFSKFTTQFFQKKVLLFSSISRMASASGDEFITVDGSYLEGGGQILRNSASFCCLLGKPLHIVNIRAGRDRPGLQKQHATGLELITSIHDAKLEGCSVGSSEIKIIPKFDFQHRLGKKAHYEALISSAGSVCLLLQISLPSLLFGLSKKTSLKLQGGTNAAFAPQLDYFTLVLKPLLEEQVLPSKTVENVINVDIVRRGYFPKGGGIVSIDVNERFDHFKPVSLMERGTIDRVIVYSWTAGHVALRVSEEMWAAARPIIEDALARIQPANHNVDFDVRVIHEDKYSAPLGDGAGIVVCAVSSSGCRLGGSALGKVKVPAATVGRNAGNELAKALLSGACVDEYAQDQLIIFMALANGNSKINLGRRPAHTVVKQADDSISMWESHLAKEALTLHTRTAIWLAEKITGAKFSLTINDETDNVELSCDGIGLKIQ